jgi:hypothetical protein
VCLVVIELSQESPIKVLGPEFMFNYSWQVVTFVAAMSKFFQKHFYGTRKADSNSILGAWLLFLISLKKYPHIFSPALMHACIRMTDLSFSTSTDPKLTCCYSDELEYMALDSNHSHDAFSSGFIVDDSNLLGMTIRDRGHTYLNKSVDSYKMVMKLETSHTYARWIYFLPTHAIARIVMESHVFMIGKYEKSGQKEF